MLSVWLSALAGGFLYFALHLTASGSFPRPLTAAQERECLQKIKEGDQQARDYFIEHNLRLVAHIIKKYYASYKEQEDLISIGTIGLIKAVGTFDSNKGIRFATYASRCIENAILSQMRLWFQINPPRAKKNQNGVFWHKFPRTSTSFVPLRTAV